MAKIDTRVKKLATAFYDFGKRIYKRDILEDVFPLFKLEVVDENKKDYFFLFDSDNVDFIYQNIVMLKKSGLEKGIEYLNKDWQKEFESLDYDIEKLRKHILFNSPSMEEIKQINDQRTFYNMYSASSRQGIFACPQCKQKNTSHREFQLRGADEGATQIAFCHDCNIQFRVG